MLPGKTSERSLQSNCNLQFFSIVKEGRLPDGSKNKNFINRNRVPGGNWTGVMDILKGLSGHVLLKPLLKLVRRWHHRQYGCTMEYKGNIAFQGWQSMQYCFKCKARTSGIAKTTEIVELMEKHMSCSQVWNKASVTSMGRDQGILCGTWWKNPHFRFKQGIQLYPPAYSPPQCTFTCMYMKTELTKTFLQQTMDMKGPGTTTNIAARTQW